MRARNIKPGFFKNEYLASLDLSARLLFIGLWCLADREGRLEDRPAKIKAEILPYDDADPDRMLEDLAHPQGPSGEHFIHRYAVDGKRYIQVLNFVRHQNPHMREAASRLPASRLSTPPVEAAATQQASGLSILHPKSTVLVEEKNQASPADSLIPDSLIPDSLIPDSLIADSLIPIHLLTSAAKQATEDLRLNGFHPTKQTKKPKAQAVKLKPQTENVETQTFCHESPRPRASPLEGDASGKNPAKASYPPEFEQFWQQYPIQTEKKRAFRLWQNRIKDRVDARDLIQAAKHYAAFCHRRRTDPYYIKEPTTFLGPLKVYKDWIEPTQKGGDNGDGR